jgi:aspartate/tyrosine/aromatic aminotransferase
MKRQNCIVVITPTIEVWGNFKKLCDAKGYDILPYHYLKSKSFPIIYKDWVIHKVPFQ